MTGSNTAVGVRTPVLPTFISMSTTFVCFSSGGYLKAIAHFGNFDVLPKASRCSKLSTFITAPSISNGNVPLISPILSTSLIASSIFVHGV